MVEPWCKGQRGQQAQAVRIVPTTEQTLGASRRYAHAMEYIHLLLPQALVRKKTKRPF